MRFFSVQGPRPCTAVSVPVPFFFLHCGRVHGPQSAACGPDAPLERGTVSLGQDAVGARRRCGERAQVGLQEEAEAFAQVLGIATALERLDEPLSLGGRVHRWLVGGGEEDLQKHQAVERHLCGRQALESHRLCATQTHPRMRQ